MSQRVQGWLFVVLGFGVFVGGVASLFDPTAGKMYIGAILCGLPIAYRGIVLLKHYYENPELHRPPILTSGATPAELYSNNLLHGDTPKTVACEECGQEYVYFASTAAHLQSLRFGPEVALEAAGRAAVRNCAVAPCPRCGRIQKDMATMAEGSSILGMILLYVGIFATFGSALFLCYVISQATATDWSRRPTDMAVSTLWIIDGCLLALGVGCLFGAYMLSQRWDPNSQPKRQRLDLAAKVSLPLEDYSRLRKLDDSGGAPVPAERP